MSRPQPPERSEPAFIRLDPQALLLLVFGLVALGAMGVWTRIALLVVLNEGVLAAAVMLAALGWGAWPAAWLRRPGRALGLSVGLALALGLGVLSILTLILGVSGALSRATAGAVLVVGGVLGLAFLLGYRRWSWPPEARAAWSAALIPAGLLIPLVAPLAIAGLGASLPPGLIWSGENRAYDALEYHLEGPRACFDAGRIHFLKHNVYTSFPQQMEMLYLLQMHLVDGPLRGAIPAQWLHLWCTIAAVAVLAAAAPRGLPRWIVAALAGSTPWLAYLGALAYVEGGLLLFTAVAAGLVLENLRSGGPTRLRDVVAIGLCLGLAGGCKYTALALVAAGLLLAWVLTLEGAWLSRLRVAFVGGAAVAVAFSPWLLRNAAFTGNPVYPFAYGWFGGQAWSAEQAEQWHRGHSLPPAQAGWYARGQGVWKELSGQMLGGATTLFALFCALRGPRRSTTFFLIWVVAAVGVWALFTQMPGRFLVPIVVPLVLLIGEAVGEWQQRGRRQLVLASCGAALFIGGMNSATLLQLALADVGWWRRQGVELEYLIGQAEAVQASQPLNIMLPPEAHAWLIGEARAFYVACDAHYHVVFNRDPWLAYAEKATPADAVARLRTQNITHLVFSWPEIVRLQQTYGFPAFVTPTWAGTLAAQGLTRVLPPTDVRLDDELWVFEVAAPAAGGSATQPTRDGP